MINLSLPETETQQTSTTQLRPRITVFGVGGAGGNAVNNMIRANLEGVDFVVANTDAQALNGSLAPKRLQLGTTITRGLGAGSRPDVGRAAAEEQIEDVLACLDNANMVFITGGMGGGTGTGAAPVIARAARERGILTVGVVTKPFHFEGAHRMRLAESGIADLQQYVDTLIIIPNQNLFRIANEKTTFADAFKMADDVLHSGVRGVTDLMIMPGLINLDFADIRSVMTEMGKAMMGTGEASGDRRALDAAEAAISNPLLDDVSMKGARGVLINITGGYDMTLFEVDEAANRIRDEVDPDANIIFGSTFDQVMEGRMRVSVVATGIDAALSAQGQPQTRGNVGMGMGMAAPVGAPAPSPASAPAPAQAPAPTAGFPPVMDRRRLGVPGVPPAVAASREAVRPGDYHAAMMQAPMAPGGAPLPGTYASPIATAAARTAEPEPIQDTGGAGRYDQAAAEAQMTAAAADLRVPLRTTEPRAYPMGAGTATQPARSNTNGPLRGERREGAFIAPRPADPGPRQPTLSTGAENLRGDAADMDKPRKRTTLFEKMTGIGSVARRFMLNDGSDMAPAPSRQAPMAGPATRPASHHPTPAAPQHQQQPRVGIEPTDRSRVNQTDEDMLDIPAFLRRQAN